MEKQQNKLIMKSFRILLIFCLPLFCVFSQEINPGKQYILGDVELSGEHNLSKNSVLKMMDLSIGQKIKLPGEEVTNGVKALWEQNIFSDIKIWQIQKDETVIVLEIYLRTLPSLSKFKFTGVKKSEEDDLREKLKLSIGMIINENVITTS